MGVFEDKGELFKLENKVFKLYEKIKILKTMVIHIIIILGNYMKKG